MAPRVSIITLTYNHEAFISRCIESVLAQTFADWEMLVVDDGSTDRTPDIVRGFTDPRVRYVSKPHAGVARLAESYNHGLRAAGGALVAILEGDDYWPTRKLETQVADFDDERVVLSFGRTQEVSTDGAPLKVIPSEGLPREALTNTPVGRAARYFLDVDVLTFAFPVSVVIRRAALERIGGFQSVRGLPVVDYPTFLELSRLGTFAFHDEVLGYWQRHASSTTRNQFHRILAGVRGYGERFRRTHASSLPISDEELRRIDRAWNDLRFLQWYSLGRWHLVDGEYPAARRAFRRSAEVAATRRERWLVRAGIAASLLRRDIERHTERLRLEPLRAVLARANADNVMISKDMHEDDGA